MLEGGADRPDVGQVRLNLILTGAGAQKRPDVEDSDVALPGRELVLVARVLRREEGQFVRREAEHPEDLGRDVQGQRKIAPLPPAGGEGFDLPIGEP